MVEKAPLAVKAYNKHIEFMGNHFNAGIKLGKGKFGKVFSLVAPLLLLFTDRNPCHVHSAGVFGLQPNECRSGSHQDHRLEGHHEGQAAPTTRKGQEAGLCRHSKALCCMSRVLTIVRHHISQLTNEIAIMKQVTHVNAVQLYEVVVRMAAPYSPRSNHSLSHLMSVQQVDQRIFIIMEYVAG